MRVNNYDNNVLNDFGADRDFCTHTQAYIYKLIRGQRHSVGQLPRRCHLRILPTPSLSFALRAKLVGPANGE